MRTQPGAPGTARRPVAAVAALAVTLLLASCHQDLVSHRGFECSGAEDDSCGTGCSCVPAAPDRPFAWWCSCLATDPDSFAKIEVDPPYPTVVTGDQPFVPFTVRNVGRGRDLTISDIHLEYEPLTEEESNDPSGPAFRLPQGIGLPRTVPPQGPGDAATEFRFWVDVKPYLDCRPREATLVIRSDDSTDLARRVHTVRLVLAPGPGLEFPAEADFGQVPKGQASTRDVVVRNPGPCRFRLDWLRFAGDPGFTWSIEGIDVVSEASGASYGLEPPLEIPPFSVRHWPARFAAVSGKRAAASFVFHGGDPGAVDGETRIDFVANTPGPCLRGPPGPVDLGTVLMGTTASVDLALRSCGSEPARIRRVSMKTPDSNAAFSIDFASMPAGKGPSVSDPLVIAPDASFDLRLKYSPKAQSPLDPANGQGVPDRGIVAIDYGQPAGPLEIEMVASGLATACPQPVALVEEGEVVKPGTVLHLHGDQSRVASGALPSYAWSLRQPSMNHGALVPAANVVDPTHEVSASGRYAYCLDVCDRGLCSSDPRCRTTACTEVVVQPDPGLVVELTWDTPGDPDPQDEGPDRGADMDLHLAHPLASSPDVDGDGEADPWFDPTFDCFWFNPRPDWESPSLDADDDPILERNDTDGAGPEVVRLDTPAEGLVYRVGVHYWDDHGFGWSSPRVRILLFGQVVLDEDLKVHGLRMKRCDLWDVARISWPDGAVTKVQEADGSHRITPDYGSHAFVLAGGGGCQPP